MLIIGLNAFSTDEGICLNLTKQALITLCKIYSNQSVYCLQCSCRLGPGTVAEVPQYTAETGFVLMFVLQAAAVCTV